MSETNQDFKWFWQTLDNYLLKNQLKQTKQRRQIVEQFLNMDTHVEAEDLYASVRTLGNNIGLATVYRTLNLLRDAGLAEQSSFADGRAVFELVKPGSHHDHLVCLDCSRIIEFENDQIEQIQIDIAKKYGFQLHDHKLELYGNCNNKDKCPHVQNN